MKLNVKRLPNRLPMPIFRRATDFYLSKLLKQPLIDRLTLNVEFKDLKGSHTGECIPEETNILRLPRKFDFVFTTGLSRGEILSAWAHELGHVKQYALGELRDLNRQKVTVWKRRRFVYNEDDDDEYWLAPWEVEANGLEAGLYTLLVKELGDDAK